MPIHREQKEVKEELILLHILHPTWFPIHFPPKEPSFSLQAREPHQRLELRIEWHGWCRRHFWQPTYFAEGSQFFSRYFFFLFFCMCANPLFADWPFVISGGLAWEGISRQDARDNRAAAAVAALAAAAGTVLGTTIICQQQSSSPIKTRQLQSSPFVYRYYLHTKPIIWNVLAASWAACRFATYVV